MSNVKTEVVLELDGRKLVSGTRDDFILDPSRGSQYFYEGNLYEVTLAIETIGDATSPQGSMLIDLLNVLFPDPAQASSLFGNMARISPEPKPAGLLTTSLDLVMVAQKERLLYLRLHCTQRGVQQKNFITQLVDSALASGKGPNAHVS
ncbi:MAG: hypothetical protein EKK48_10035 [Candidatus Melainabacteria bacterium]|nr:MAG: hypothetical protein EKK48_10035 [Candidatus Melainabacteria bacterium]